jgi:hypothetical protein
MFHTCVASVYLDVAYVLQWFSSVFASVSDACFKCFISLQMYIACVAFGCFKSRSGIASPSLLSVSPQCLLLLLVLVGHPPAPPLLLDAGDVRGSASPAWVYETGAGMDCRRKRPDVRALANLIKI